ncbi:MAG: sigma factor [Oscillospiraceae bacterium]
MEDEKIIGLYWDRNEEAIAETASKYGKRCFQIANNILASHEDSEECVNDTYLGLWNAVPKQKPARFSVFVSRVGSSRPSTPFCGSRKRKSGSSSYAVTGILILSKALAGAQATARARSNPCFST